MTTKKKVNSKINVNRRRTSSNKQARLRKSYSSQGTSTVTVRGKEAGKGLTKPTSGKKNNNRKSGKVITNRTSNKSFKRGTTKKIRQKLPMTAFMITPVLVIFRKLNPLSRNK